MRWYSSLAFLGLAFGLGSAPAEKPKSTLADLSWLSGSWTTTTDGVEIEEYWMTPKGGVMLGLNRTTRPKAKGEFEFMRLEERSTGIVFVAQPSGKPGTEFPVLQSAEKQVVFENKNNKFPQRITYKLDDKNRLVGRIDGEIECKPASMEWTWEKVK